MEVKYGLDKPLTQQYLSYITGLITRADMGLSLKYPNRDVVDILKDAIPISLVMGSLAFSLALIIGFALAFWAVVFQDSAWAKSTLEFFTSSSLSVPSFVFAGIFVWLLGLQLDLLPVALLEGPEYMVLPVLSLAIIPAAYIAKISYASLSEAFSKKYIVAARAKGLGEISVLLRHALKNALLPILTILGPLFAILITGSFVIEHIFALPGMGKYFVTAFINRDYFLVIGVVIVFASILLVINSLIDLMILLIDPRLKE